LSGIAIKILADREKRRVKDEPPAVGTVQDDQSGQDASQSSEKPKEKGEAQSVSKAEKLSDRNSEHLNREQNEVDADVPIGELQNGPPPPIDDPEPPAFRAVRLPSGKEITADDLKPLSPAEIKAQFPVDSPVFALKRSKDGSPEGLFTFTFTTKKTKEFVGPALVIHPNGHSKVILSYAKNVRNGILRYWNVGGALVLFSEYKNGNKLGMTFLCEEGRPVLVEEWGTSQQPKSYLIEIRNKTSKAVRMDETDESQRRRLDEAIAGLGQIEHELFTEERRWKRTFYDWWNEHDDEIKRLERAIDKAEKAKDAIYKKRFQTELDELRHKIKSESTEGTRQLLDALRPE
jgi:antitoxin component YwqK of YwqJK toxin-antitoxin module